MKTIYVVGLLLAFWAGAEGYTTFKERWSSSKARVGIPFLVNVKSFPFPEAEVMRIVQEAFKAWEEVPSAFIRFQYAGTTQLELSFNDNRNVIYYDATGKYVPTPKGVGFIATARWQSYGSHLADVDIVFNGRDKQFSIDAHTTPAGLYDLQAVMIHEIGHLLGLDHSAWRREPELAPTMFPWYPYEAPRTMRSLEADDRAGITALYPVAGRTGGVRGRVVSADDGPVLGAHVVAFQAGSDVFVAGALSGFLHGGRYEILGLVPGDYQLAIVPHSPLAPAHRFHYISQLYEVSQQQDYNNGERVSVAVDGVVENIDFFIPSKKLGSGGFAPSGTNRVSPPVVPPPPLVVRAA